MGCPLGLSVGGRGGARILIRPRDGHYGCLVKALFRPYKMLRMNELAKKQSVTHRILFTDVPLGASLP
ncbi:hypothetical protein EMIT0357P_70250 [Pseudomonas marginalis]